MNMPDKDPFDFDPENVTGKYVLDEHDEPVEEPHLLKWAMWMETRERVVLDETISRVRISTIFLAVDMGIGRMFDRTAKPLLWETMVFGHSVFDRWQWRYRSKLDALRGHQIVRELIERFGDPPRQLKKAIKKRWQPMRPRERRRAERWYGRVRAYEQRRIGELP